MKNYLPHVSIRNVHASIHQIHRLTHSLFIEEAGTGISSSCCSKIQLASQGNKKKFNAENLSMHTITTRATTTTTIKTNEYCVWNIPVKSTKQ